MRYVTLMVALLCIVTAPGNLGAQGASAPAKAEPAPKPADWPTLRQERETLLKDIADLERELPDLRSQEQKLSVLENELKKIQSALNNAKDEAERQRLRPNVEELTERVKGAKSAAERRLQIEQTLKTKKDELAKLDSKIGVLLAPEILAQSFKTWMSVIFAGLVLAIMVGFFVIAWRDETVRRAIFTGAAGIQFITLFSLVIAIILFGITGILEGKELAALLGGLSGYILGRGTGPSGPPSPPAAPHTPSPPSSPPSR